MLLLKDAYFLHKEVIKCEEEKTRRVHKLKNDKKSAVLSNIHDIGENIHLKRKSFSQNFIGVEPKLLISI